MTHHLRARFLSAIAIVLAVVFAVRIAAQGVTTASIDGVVKDAQGGVAPGASILAVHEPSGTTYQAVTQADGRFVIPGMRVGGTYNGGFAGQDNGIRAARIGRFWPVACCACRRPARVVPPRLNRRYCGELHSTSPVQTKGRLFGRPLLSLSRFSGPRGPLTFRVTTG